MQRLKQYVPAQQEELKDISTITSMAWRELESNKLSVPKSRNATVKCKGRYT